MKYILGVDPGFNGGLAIYDPETHRIVHVLDMPLLPSRKDKKGKDCKPEVDAFLLSQWISLHSKDLKLAVLEAVNAHPGQSVSAMFRFGYFAGMTHGVLASCNVETKFVQPAVWKAALGLSADKAKSMALVAKLFPNDTPLFARKKDDGRAEAVLLAYLGGLMTKLGSQNKK